MWKIQSCTRNDACYPDRLRKLKNAPEILYYVGDITVCKDNVIAVIGRRASGQRYMQISYAIGKLLAGKNYTVLNGLAIGCDTRAMEGAADVNGKAAAVMPCGLDEVYPGSNRRLAEKIVNGGGCLISEYPDGIRPCKYMFVRRDRIQAALAQKVIVVNADRTGGTMHTAEYAVELFRPVGCFMENSFEESPAGNRILVENGRACTVRGTEELWKFVSAPAYEQMTLFG